MIELTTKRLVLRHPRRGDAHALVDHLNDFDIVKWLSNVPYPYTETDAEDWIQLVNKTIDDKDPSFQFSIFMSNALIGGVGLKYADSACYELGYWLAKDYWGQGLALEAATQLIRYGKEQLTDPHIIAHCMKGNAQSESVLRKLGFKVVDEVEIYSIPQNRLMPCSKLSLR